MSIFGVHIANAVDFFSEPITIRRPGTPTVVAGRVTNEGTPTESTAIAAVQPANQKDLDQVPPGTIKPGDAIVHTTTEILLRDEIEFDDVRWFVVAVTFRPASGTYKAFCTKVDR